MLHSKRSSKIGPSKCRWTLGVLVSLPLLLWCLSSWLRSGVSIEEADPEALRLLASELSESELLDAYCRFLEKGVPVDGNPESESPLSRAKRAKLIRQNLIFFPPLNQMWCLVPKAASTSWSKLLLQKLNENSTYFEKEVKSRNGSKPLQVILKDTFGHINKMKYIDALRNKEVMKILLVRHPFARIASAYRDKLEDRRTPFDGPYFYQ